MSDKIKSNKAKKRSEIWRKLNFKYRISATNENTLEEIWQFRSSMFWGALLFLVFTVMLVVGTATIIITTPIRNYLPGYLDVEVRDKALHTAIELDALQKQVHYQEAYMRNLKGVLDGEVDKDSIKTMLDTIYVPDNDPMLMKTQREKDYVQRYSEDEMYNLSVLVSEVDIPLTGAAFYKPVKGLVAETFSPSTERYGVKINVDKKETVMAALDGTVMYAGYSAVDGYTIQIQHNNGFVSQYKHSTMLLKKPGDKVRTGEAIAVVEADKEKDSKGVEKNTFVVIELWLKGKPVDPQNYIFF